jgi:hypothetical protein
MKNKQKHLRKLYWVALLSLALLSSACAISQSSQVLTSTTSTATITNTAVNLKAVAATGWFEGDIQLTNPSLDVARNRMGEIWVPVNLPGGFFLGHLFVNGNWVMNSEYRNASGKHFWVDQIASSANLPFPKDSVDEYMWGNTKVYIVRGSWARIDGVDTWEPDGSLMLLTTRGNFVIEIRAYNANDWTKAELFQIAASLERY